MRSWPNSAVSNLISGACRDKAGTCRVSTEPVSLDPWCINRRNNSNKICSRHTPDRWTWLESHTINTVTNSMHWTHSNTAPCFLLTKLMIIIWRHRNWGPRYLWARANLKADPSWKIQTKCKIITWALMTLGAKAALSATRSGLCTMKALPASSTTTLTRMTTSWTLREILMIWIRLKSTIRLAERIRTILTAADKSMACCRPRRQRSSWKQITVDREGELKVFLHET